MFITLTEKSNSDKVIINVNHIVSYGVTDEVATTSIITLNGGYLVNESVELISEVLRENYHTVREVRETFIPQAEHNKHVESDFCEKPSEG
jgi:regulator of protease activity HflC (stomatin/prohibitin superfamily)